MGRAFLSVRCDKFSKVVGVGRAFLSRVDGVGCRMPEYEFFQG